MDSDYVFKVLLIGDSGVGKSSLMLKFAKVKTRNIDGKTVRLQIWDTAGHDRFKTIITSNYRNADGMLVVYDMTDLESFQNVRKWLDDIDHYSNERVYKVMVGNLIYNRKGQWNSHMLRIRFNCVHKGLEEDNFFLDPYYRPCTAVDFKIKTIDIDCKKVQLQILEPYRLERFRSLTHAYCRFAHGIFIVYDITDLNSFQNVHKWLGQVNDCSDEKVYKVLVGNKVDLQHKRVMEYEEAKRYADQNNLPVIETSAKTSYNVEQMFVTMAAQLKENSDKSKNAYLSYDNKKPTIKGSRPIRTNILENCLCM